jgi:hypothetical protein
MKKPSKDSIVRQGDIEWTVVNGKATSPRISRTCQRLINANRVESRKQRLDALPPLVNPTYDDRLERAERLAEIQDGNAGIEQAKEAFLEHWFRANTALRTITTGDDTELIQAVAPWIGYAVGSLSVAGRKHPALAGSFVFRSAKKLCYDVLRMSQENPPPSWLIEFAGAEYEIPWLMVNGKPAHGYDGFEERLRPGQLIIKRGKSRFDSPQTRFVAQVLHRIEHDRTKPLSEAMHRLQHEWRKTLETKYPDAERNWSTLPPLTRKTKKQWWPFVEDEVRIWMGAPILTKKELQSIRKTLTYNTEKALMTEFLKRCKKSFDGLCPKD